MVISRSAADHQRRASFNRDAHDRHSPYRDAPSHGHAATDVKYSGTSTSVTDPDPMADFFRHRTSFRR